MDRLQDFRRAVVGLGPSESPMELRGPVLPLPIAPAGSQEAETVAILENYFEVVNTVTESIEDIYHTLREMSRKHEQAMETINVEKCDAIRNEISEMDNNINESMQRACQGVEKMNELTKQLKDTPANECKFAGVIRLEENQRRYMFQKLSTVIETVQKQQLKAEKNYLSQTERRIKIAYTNPDGTTLDDDTVQQLATQVMKAGATSAIFQQSKDVLAQMLETRNDIYRIEMSMRSLNRLFSDMAILVEEQGNMMDVILRNIDSAKTYMEKSHEELRQARAYQQSSRRKLMCMLLISAVIIGLFVTAGLLGSLL
ncbi:unnamed protein product [Trypanosoma congolense IL3000]|uniref:Uncharacterized protein TCIL3000_11_9100 n=1 Tax=Trypanosoma congolense (strain IL3000) TaxID=1068625 RepID=F9W4C0_TRYCI|nr:unnamed protein product [Trypanosoma congolense IL3000]CCD12009.1 unnamed protein product [Trypanosoma congolense IL3000]